MTAPLMGYQALLYMGNAGATAASLLENARDIKYDNTPQAASTTARGDGTSVPKESGEVTSIDAALTWTMIVKTNDTLLTALISAARTGSKLALRCIPATGSTGLDADASISMSQGMPLNGEQTIDFAVVKFSNAQRAILYNS